MIGVWAIDQIALRYFYGLGGGAVPGELALSAIWEALCEM